MKKSYKRGSKDPKDEMATAIQINAEDEISVELTITLSDHEEYDFSSMNYDEAMDHLTQIGDEIHNTNEVRYSEEYLTSLFERLVRLSDYQKERMERTLVVIDLYCNLIELILLSKGEESMFDIDGEFSFPISKDIVQMPLEGLIIPEDWETEDDFDFDLNYLELYPEISDMDYDELVNHLIKVMNEMDEFTGVPYSKEFFTEYFELLIDLSESNSDRMEKTLVILDLVFNYIEGLRLYRDEEPLWGYENDMNFPIPKEKIKMSLKGLETPYHWYPYDEDDIELEEVDDKYYDEILEEVTV